MESTGDAHRYRRDVRMLLALLVVLFWTLVYVTASGAIADTDSNLPPCGSGNYLAGTCAPDKSGWH